jgi:nucleotide-binding universal stress UspA family protein
MSESVNPVIADDHTIQCTCGTGRAANTKAPAVAINRIVVGVDGSAAATTAARWAAREAAIRIVELCLVHVVHADLTGWPQTGWPAIPLPPEVGEAQLAQGEKVLEETLADIATTTGQRQPRNITTRICIGAVAPTLREFARHPDTMIVVGRRGRGGMHRALLGSVSSAMLHTAHCPVAVVHDMSTIESTPAPVVLGVDGSPASEYATAIAFDEAWRRAVELIAVHATDHADAAQAEHLLSRRLAEYQRRFPRITVRRVITGAHPADALLAQSQHAQLVVVGSRGRGGLAGKLLGSVSAAVVQACRTPVIVAGRQACSASPPQSC